MISTFFLYNSILLFSFFFAYCGEKVGNKRQEVLCRIMVFLVLWIPASLRYGIGTDYFSYQSIYEHIDWYTDDLEIGYVFLNKLIQSLSLGHEFLFSAVAGITYVPICFGLPKKGYRMLVLFYVLTLYLSSYSMMRQSMSISFSLYATIQLLKGRNAVYFVVIIIASSFHISALLLLSCFFFKYIKFNRTFGILLLIFGVLFIVKINFIERLFESDIFLNSTYGNYATGSFNHETEMGSGLGVIARALIPCLLILLAPNLQNERIGNGFIVGISIAYLYAQVLSVQIHIFNRLVDIVSFILVIGVGVINIIHWKYRQIVLVFTFFLFLLLFEKGILQGQSRDNGGLGISPYTSICLNK